MLVDDGAFNFAIETSGRIGEIALGQADRIIASAPLPRRRGHGIGLIPTIDQLCREIGLRPNRLTEVYVSLGPGSFTGLRIAIATVKMLALSRQVRLVGVPTIEAIMAEHPHSLVCLNESDGTAYCAGSGLKPKLRSMDQIQAIGLPLIRDATPRAQTIWQLGRNRAYRGQYDDPARLAPLYIRKPKAVILWDQRQRAEAIHDPSHQSLE